MSSKYLTLVAIGSVLIMAGCTTVIEEQTNESVKTEAVNSTTVNGKAVTNTAYRCQMDVNAKSESGATSGFLIGYIGEDKAVMINDSRSYPLSRVRSASGSKYASIDGLETFWEHGDQATIQLDGITYENCNKVD